MSDLNAMLDEYRSLEEKIYEHFGYVEDWTVFPLDDRRGLWWYVTQHEVIFQYGKAQYTQAMVDAEMYVKDVLYTGRGLPKSVFRAENHTLICVDTQVDGNIFLAIYDNDREIKKLIANL
jgi:hypothetical protein